MNTGLWRWRCRSCKAWPEIAEQSVVTRSPIESGRDLPVTLVLYREKRRWKFDVADGDGYESVLFGADNILDRLARLAETLTLDVSAIETRADGEIALVAVEGSDLRGWRLFRRREGEEFGFLSPAVLELLGLPDVLFLNRAGSDA